MSIEIKISDFGLRVLQAEAQIWLKGVAEDIKSEAKRVVPVDTGNLRDSITIRDGIDQNEKLIGTDVHYARHVEFGTVHMPPRPYLRNSLDKVVGDI